MNTGGGVPYGGRGPETGAWNGYQKCRSLRREYSRLSAHTASTPMADDAIPARAIKLGSEHPASRVHGEQTSLFEEA